MLAMTTHGKCNGGHISALVMATRSKGNNGQIAGARGKSNVKQVNGLCRECNDGQIAALMMARLSKGNEGGVAGARDGHAQQRRQQENCQRVQ